MRRFMKTKISLVLYCIVLCSSINAADHVNVFGGMPFPGYTTTAPAAYNNSQASLISAQGGYAIDITIAGMNMQNIESKAMDNHLKRIDTFFQGRSNNRFYRDMEEWRQAERIRLKALGQYDGDAIRKLYGK